MLHKLLIYASPALVAVLALGSLTPATPASLAVADVQLVDDQASNMSLMDYPPDIPDVGPPLKPPCPPVWTCDWANWFPSRAECQAVCGAGNCAQDYNCDGTCVCP
jgi:hypothetical protein